ncbi:MAG: MFS transporter, partial [Peptococcaceae bacterium]|nr:MFS transporter [Peptococcaceae bacterium]
MSNETEPQAQQYPPQVFVKIWNKTFISIFFASMAMNLGQQMSTSLLAIYADSLGAPATKIGLLISMFALTALLFKVIAAPAIDTYNRKYLVIGAMLILAASFFGFSLSTTLSSLMFFRLLQGIGLAFSNVCCLAMAAESLPKEKYGTGIGYYSLAQVASQAVGPAIGLAIAGAIGYPFTFAINAGVMLLAVIAAMRIKITFKRTKKLKITLNNIIAKEALLPALVQLFLSMQFMVVNSFLIVFAAKQGVTSNIGFFFTVSFATMLFTRPLVGKLTDKFGLVKVFIPALFSNLIAFILISYAYTLPLFLLAAFISAFGFGACTPAIQTLAMKLVSNERRGAGSSTNYIGADIGTLIGPVAAGSVAQLFGYAVMWRAMLIPLFIAMSIVFLARKKIGGVERA